MASRKTVRGAKKVGNKQSGHKRSAGTRRAKAGESLVTVRLYCQGIGDCHLLKFTQEDGKPFWMLIDCGVHSSIAGGSRTVDAIVDDILSETKGRLDVVIATHEHWDHISGFRSAQEKFKRLEIGQIWMAWTEDPEDHEALALDRYKGQALAAIQGASARLAAAGPLAPHLAGVRSGIESILGFVFSAQGEKVRAARDALESLAPDRVEYLEPSQPPITLPGLPNLRIYVLGPPRNDDFLKIRERAREMYRFGGRGASSLADALASAFAMEEGGAYAEDPAAPFDSSVGSDLASVLEEAARLTAETACEKAASANAPADPSIAKFVSKHYARPEQSWRRIDADWLGVSADLALQLDNKTNNTSLVLAFELVDSGRVLLFAADAQVGNWLSWEGVKWRMGEREVTGPDLMKRTVFYKVGHHGSQNATLQAKGLELMTDRDLSAFIPTNEQDAKKVGWGEMPFHGICEALRRRAGERVIRADDPWIAGNAMPPQWASPSGSIRGVRYKKSLWVELDIA